MDGTSIVGKWVTIWDERGTFLAGGGPERPRAYVVSMFPYPSGDLHMGHAEAYSIGDAIARFARMRGFDVLHPIGWDSFGLPAENAAIKRDRHPGDWTYANIEVQARSFRRLGISFDWRTRLHTSDPGYYRWNQWLFLRMFERGLAYRRQAPVNWCPSDLTVLANEQVIDGRCERCGAEVVLRPLTQWFLRTTAYAQRLLDDMRLLDWPEDVLAMQRNWIGRSSEGTAVSYRLRDWLVSRQRFWGTPIPIVHCPGCGEVPLPDEELPLLLPEEGCQLRPTDGRSPLATAEAWVAVACPRCGGAARRDTDTMDTFVDSSWYFLRYPDVHFGDGPFDPDAVRRWLPVGDYIGGREHATGHLIYARFITKVLYDLGLIDFVEPFTRLTNQGHVLMNGRAMSKTLGNLVDLRDQIERYGPDAVRLTMLFAGPPGDDIDWADVSPAGAVKFLHRVGRLAAGAGTSPAPAADSDLRREVHRLVAETTALMERRRLNVAIATLMKLTAVLRGTQGDPAAVREGVEFLVRMLSCFAPFTAEEAWERLGHGPSVVDAGWPEPDPALAVRDTAICVVQIDGKVRDRLEVPADIDEQALRALVLALPHITGLDITRTVVRPPRIVNVLTAPESPPRTGERASP